ncbi:Iso dh and/or Mito carr domain containing protein [Asbolus verrucosus]|uniref:Iso dh and/or Mito carr domain containing protein n=1 Tax=Asbolus verrucosus TaxID=1661398 RepID=A0A482VL67_ASBVE|nr:Iso dh and/or Mito carr domain containing protein [Asbolus verrucosus]
MDFAIGGAAAVCAGFFTNPLEVMKTRMQLQGELRSRGHHAVHYKNVFHAGFVITKHDGILALQAGLVPGLWFQLVLNGYRFGLYQILDDKGYMKDKNGKLVFHKSVLIGGFAGASGAFIASPFYLIKTHLQSQASKEIAFGHQYHYKGTWSGLWNIFKEQGVKGLFRGGSSAVPRAFVGSTSQLTSFAYCKEFMKKYDILSNSPLLASFTASMVGGIAISVMMTPFDLVSTRLYNQDATKSKILVQKPIVEIDGDEMTKLIFDEIKQKLLFPFVEIQRDYYDCSLINRNKTENQVSKDAAAAILKHNVGVKCSTITPDEERVKEFNLTQMWPSPNGMIRNALNGTQFRESVICKNITKYVPGWTKPIIMGRHTFGDQYGGKDLSIKKPSKIFITVKSEDGKEESVEVFSYNGRGVAMLTFNTEDSIRAFAVSCFRLALERNYPLYFATKNVVGQGFGSMGLMIHSLVSHDGKTILTEPAHGTVTRHYREYEKGMKTSTNPISSIFAWTRGLQHRAKLDSNTPLNRFTKILEKSTIDTVESGLVTKDLAPCVFGKHFKESQYLSTSEFIDEVLQRLNRNL